MTSQGFTRSNDEQSVDSAERAVMDGLFGEAGRDDPQSVLRSADIPGTHYDFARAVLHDRNFVAPMLPDSSDLIFQLLGRFMIRLPPDRHAAIRKRFTGLFTPRRIDNYRRAVEERSAALIDAMTDRGASGDLVADFAAPLPFTVIAGVLGVPVDRHDWLLESMSTLGRGFAGQRSRPPVEQANAATADMLAYFDALLDQRASEPADDLASLLALCDEHERDDVLANCIFFLLAGHVTTTTMLCGGITLLLEAPEERRPHDDTSWDLAVEEVLRLVSPITLTVVRAEEAADVAGHHVAAGDQRMVAYAAANRDSAVFAQPDSFDPRRNPNPHLAFSAGATFCLGAPLARLHGRVALPMLLDRLPNLRLGEPVWRGSVPARQIETLRCTW